MKPTSPDSTRILHVLFLLLAVGLLYFNTVDSPFVFDDSQIFEINSRPLSGLSLEGLRQVVAASPNKNRIVPNISFALNYLYNGDDPAGYHWVNIAVHAASAVAVYFLLSLVISICFPGNEKGLNRETALLAALLWAVHPLQTNGVTYIVQRMTSMAALFYLLSVLFYLKARLHRQGAQGPPLFLAAVFGVMALFSKENTAVLPITIAACEVFFIRADRIDTVLTRRNLLLCAILLGGFLLLCLALLGTDPLAKIMKGYEQRDFTLAQRLLTEPRVIFHYLTLLVLPLPSRLNLAYDYPLSTGLLAPPWTLAALIGLIGLAAGIVLLFKHHRLTAFALFWLLINLCVESSFIPLMIAFEHRMYLPSVFLIGAGAAWCYRLAGGNRLLARSGLAVLAILFAFFSWQRNGVWQTELGLWSDVASKSPGLAWVHSNLGKVYAREGQYQLAEQSLNRALALDPYSGLAYLNLGVMYDKLNRLSEARIMYEKAENAKLGDRSVLYGNMAILAGKLGDYDSAIRNANKAMELKPYKYKSYDILSTTYLRMGNYAQAEKVLLAALDIFPEMGDAYIRLSAVYEKQNRLPLAKETLDRAFAARDVNLAKAYNQSGILLWRMNRLQESIEAAQKAIEADPDYLDAYLTLGISYEDAGQLQMAFNQFNLGWQRGLDMIRMYNSWADQQLKSNNPGRAILYLRQAVGLDAQSAVSHMNLARAYEMKGMAAEAAYERKLAGQLAPGR